MRKSVAFFLGFSTVLICGLAFGDDANPVLKIADGMPKVAEVIGEQSFVPETVERLKNAKVWWVDYDWHRQHGIEIPKDGISDPKFADQVLEAYAWQSRGIEDHDGQYTGEKKNWFSDYYGGWGMGTNVGSGRAAAMGLVQAKGTRTSMAKSNDPWHSNGAVQSIEAVDEAIWSQVLESEMTHGSNKVVAVILTGTYARMKDSNQVFPRALIIREMAVRPAHFMLNPWRHGLGDRIRVDGAMKNFLASLPLPEGYEPKSDGDRLRVGLFEHVDREAKAEAEYYAKRLYFGSHSPSNVELSGRRLDLGDHTAQEGYTPIYRVDFNKGRPSGDPGAFTFVFENMMQSWQEVVPANLKQYLPTAKEVTQRFEKQFEYQKRVELAKLSGAPAHLVEKLKDNSRVQDFGKTLLAMARAGQPKTAVFTDPNGWKTTGTYNINKMLTEIAQAKSNSVVTLYPIIARQQGVGLAEAMIIARAYLNFKSEIQAEAAKDGVSADSLNEYMRITAERKNKTATNLIRGHKRWRELWDTTDKGIPDGTDPRVVENYIDTQVAQAVTTFKDAKPYEAVIEQKVDHIRGITDREVFDAKTGKVERVELIHPRDMAPSGSGGQCRAIFKAS